MRSGSSSRLPWLDVSERRQQDVADQLGTELRARLPGETAKRLLQRWKRAQPFIFAR